MKVKLWAVPAIAALSVCGAIAAETWTTGAFEDFRKGFFGNGGQNIYVSANGTLQRIHHSDINLDGEVDLLFCNTQAHEEYVHPEAYFAAILMKKISRFAEFTGNSPDLLHTADRLC